jgi:regulator of protease activity HflC (stomatin/prohibitin superfamily)
MAFSTNRWGVGPGLPVPGGADSDRGRSVIRYRGYGVLGLIASLVLMIIAGSWYTIDQTQRGVLLRNGAFIEVEQPGLHFKLPLIESVYKIDVQTHTRTYGAGQETMEAYSADQQPAHLRVSVTFHVDPGKAQEMYNRFAGDMDAAVSRLITPRMNQEVKVVFGQYTAQRAIGARGQLNVDAAKALSEAIAYDPIFAIEGVQIEDIAFSNEYIRSVEARMQAEVEVQRQQQTLAQEKIKAEIAVTQATGRANSIRAEAQAQADAIVLRGDAEAKAIKARADALASNANLIALTQAEKWNGQLPTTMVPNGAVPFLNVAR